MKKKLNLEFSASFSFFWAIVAFAAIAVNATGHLHAEETYDLIHQVSSDETFHIKSQVQYLGSVIVDKAGKAENQKALALDVRGRFEFDQRISSGSTTQPQAIRYFEEAKASIKVGQGKTESSLDESNRLVLARMKDDLDGNHHFQIASIGGTLRQKEYELLRNPGDPLSYTDLFQKQDVKVGEKWKLDKEQFTSLLNLNRVISDSVTMMLKSVESNQAKVYIYGSVKGEVDDAITNLKIKAIAQLDLKKKLVTAMRMSIDEERRAGQLAPGFEGQIKLDTRISPTTENIMLSKNRLSELYQGKKIKFSFLFDRPDNEFQLLHNNRWRVIASEDEAAVLRYVDDGQMIAQCNVVQLPNRPIDSPLKLSQFQEEVRKIISDAEARIVDNDRFQSTNGYEILKVAVEGIESDIPFSWLYYHVAANDGRRVTFVFTLEKDAEEYLGTADRKLVQSIQFKDPRQAKTENSTAR